MPFDAAARPVAEALTFSEAVPVDLAYAFEAAGEPDRQWALQNPDRALALLMVSPRPCAALDALLSI